jgi:predicted RNase H-like HicB family nuclease
MKYIYPACFYPEDDGRYSIILPDFPLATYGDNLEDALSMAQDAAIGRIFTMLEHGEIIPRPSKITDITLEQPNGFTSFVYFELDAAKAAIDTTPVKKTLTIPAWLNTTAEKKNIKFSAVLKDALLERIAN